MSGAQVLLPKAIEMYERYDAGRREPFNVFMVLRTQTDEVNLHSRFLVAVLDWLDASSGEKENLKDFLQTVAGVDGFGMKGVTVQRERHRIDILIANARKQAVLIENKIDAQDQERQLERYYEKLKLRGFEGRDIHVRYLTPFGDDPSEDSRGGLRCENIAYRATNFQNWLRNCRERAGAEPEPALEASIRQYLQVIQRMTGTDGNRKYMKELQQLCRQGENLVVIHDLKKAADEVHVGLLVELFDMIEARLQQELEGLPARSDASDVSEDTLMDLVMGRKRPASRNISFDLGSGAALCVWVDERFSFGVLCDGSHPDRAARFREDLKGFHDNGYCWWRYVDCTIESFRTPTRQDLKILADDAARRDTFETLAATLAREMRPVWTKISASGLQAASEDAP